MPHAGIILGLILEDYSKNKRDSLAEKQVSWVLCEPVVNVPFARQLNPWSSIFLWVKVMDTP